MPKLKVDGEEYELTLDFNMGEARVIHRYSGMTLKDVEEAFDKDNEAGDPTNPNLIAGILHNLIKRRYPELRDKVIERRINETNLVELIVTDEEDDASPPEPAPSSERTSGGDGEPPTETVATPED